MEQSIIPPYMGYIANTGGSDSNAAAMAALAAAAATKGTGYTDGGFGGGGIMSAILLSSLLGRNGLVGGNGDVSGNNTNHAILSDLRKDVGDAALEAAKTESRIQAAIQVQDANNNVNFRALDNKICETQKDAIVVGKDAIINSLQIEARTTDRITNFERNVDNQFCDVKSQIAVVKNDLGLQIERGFCDLREKTLEDKVAELLRAQDDLKNNLLFSNQINAINSTLQNQHMANKVVQFGTGNAAIPTNTQNQVG